MKSMLAGVSPAARALLMRRVEQSRPPDDPPGDAGGPPPAAEASPPAPSPPESRESGRIPEGLRESFFAPIFPFVVRAAMPEREPGRIPWSDCERVWTWLARDLAKAEIAEAEAAGRTAASDARIREAILARAADAVGTAAASDSGQRRLASRIGMDEGFVVLGNIVAAFANAAWVAEAIATLPHSLTRLQIDQRPGILSAFATAARGHPAGTAWLYAALLTRLENSGSLARIAVVLANTDRDEELSRTIHAPAVGILLSEIEIEVERLRALRSARAPIPAIERCVSRYRQLVRDLSAEVDLRPSTRWSRRLAAAKVNASSQLEQDVTRAAGLTRQVLPTRLLSGETPILDSELLDDAERALRVVNIATGAGEVLTLNAAVTTARRELDRTFEAFIDPLINALRSTHGEERRRLLLRCDGAIRLAGIHYGPEFEAILHRSRNVAIAGRVRVPANSRT